MTTFEIDEYNILGIKAGANAWTCPKCSHLRKPQNQNQKCMSVFWDTGLGHCNHCGERVQLHTYKKKRDAKVYTLPVRKPTNAPLSDLIVSSSINTRGIGLDALNRLKIGEGKRWMPKANAEVKVMEFPYFVHGKLVNVKYRAKDKDFMFEKGCELVMYNLDAIMHEKECVVVEGEFDALSFVEAGIYNVTSVPNGFTLPKSDGNSSVNLSFLDDYYEFFENKEKIYIAVDNDKAGKCGEAELISRFGSEKCWLVDFDDCKDANEYLLKYGKEKLAGLLQTAKQVPIDYVETLEHFEDELEDFWLNGSPKGLTTGMKNLDAYYSIEFGQYTIITGAPSSGKSEFVDAMCIGYAMKYGHSTAFASPENKPNKYHADKIIKKITGYKPTTLEEVKSRRIQRAKEFYKKHFYHVTYNEGYELTSVLAKFKELRRRKGVRIFVIDPYNKIKLKSSSDKNINDYTSDYLQLIDTFCRQEQVIVMLVAHPTKMQKEDGKEVFQMPTAYNIKGGGEMYDMAYHILGLVKLENMAVKVKTLKVKFLHLGENDQTFFFKWNINNGRYVSIEETDLENGTIHFDNGDWLVDANHTEIQETTERNYFPPVRNFSEPIKLEEEEYPF